MNLEARKINLINWISSLQDENILEKVEKIQKNKVDWWDSLCEEDKSAIHEGLHQLDNGEFFTHEQVRTKIKDRFKF